MSAPSPLFPELGSPPVASMPSFVCLRDSGYVMIAPKGAWSILLKPSPEGLQMKVKQRNADNCYDDVYEFSLPDINEMTVAQLVTHGVAYIAAKVLQARKICGHVKTRVRDFTASVVVRTDDTTLAVVEVAYHPRYKVIRVGNQTIPCDDGNSLNTSLFLGAAAFLSVLN